MVLTPLSLLPLKKKLMQSSIISDFELVTIRGVTFTPEFVSSSNEERKRCLKAEDIASALTCWVKSSMEWKNFKISELKFNLAALKARRKRSIRKISLINTNKPMHNSYRFRWNTITYVQSRRTWVFTPNCGKF